MKKTIIRIKPSVHVQRQNNGKRCVQFGWIDTHATIGARGRYFSSGPSFLRNLRRFIKAYPRVIRNLP